MADVTSVIEQAVADSGLSDATPETPVDTPPVEASADADPAPAPAPPAEPTEEDELSSIEKELVTKTPDLAKGRLSVSRHQAVVTRIRRQAEAERKKLEAEFEPLKQYSAPDVQERLQAIRLAETHPTVFLRQVLLNDPRYQAEIDKLLSERAPKPEAAAPAPDPADEKPKPDRLEADGTLGYSADGAQKLLDWHERHVERKHKADLDALRKEISPVLEKEKHQAAVSEAMTRMRPVLENARATWDGFTEYEADIRAELHKPGNEKMTLHDAYRVVVIPKLRTDRAALEADLRKKIVDEMNVKAPKPTLRPGTLPPAVGGDPATPRALEDVIRESIRSARA